MKLIKAQKNYCYHDPSYISMKCSNKHTRFPLLRLFKKGCTRYPADIRLKPGVYILHQNHLFSPPPIIFFPQFCGVRRAFFTFFFMFSPIFPLFSPFSPFFLFFPLFFLLFSPFFPFFFFPFLHFFPQTYFFHSFPPPGGE